MCALRFDTHTESTGKERKKRLELVDRGIGDGVCEVVTERWQSDGAGWREGVDECALTV